jgi:transposase
MKKQEMKVINLNAAGIDIGSKSHFVGVGQGLDEVKEFGVYSSDHQKIIEYLQAHKITTIAMESTGSYWQTLFFTLQKAGFEVLLVSGHQTKNLRAKTDVKDCQWIQKLHTLGLLRGCFLPDDSTNRLRVLHRHRSSLVEESSKMTNKMQKALRMMNLRLDVVLSDITGKSGMAIIKAILSGERTGEALAQLADSRVRKSKEQIADALQGQWSDEYIYELNDCFELYMVLQAKIQQCDQKIEALLLDYTQDIAYDPQEVSLTKKQVKGKNQPRFDLTTLSYKYYGVDLFAIEGVSMNTILTLITEIGQGIYKFKTAKEFASFLRLAPNNRISGGKIISSRTPKGGNKFALSLRNAANTIDRKKEGSLMHFFKRIGYRKGRAAAITATARKLAVIIWNMIVKKQEYKPMDEKVYKDSMKTKAIKSIERKMKKLGITNSELSIT